MPVPTDTPDPRPRFAAALDQVEQLLDATEPTDLGRPTPCAEYDVQALLAHLVAVLRKLEVVSNHGDMTRVTDPADDVAGHEADAFRRARTECERAWASHADLSADFTVAWGTMSGAELLDAYTHEFTVHAWDLAQTTGGGERLDPALADAALDWFTRNVTAEDRIDGGPFAPVVPVPDDADVFTRLAGFVGRQV